MNCRIKDSESQFTANETISLGDQLSGIQNSPSKVSMDILAGDAVYKEKNQESYKESMVEAFYMPSSIKGKTHPVRRDQLGDNKMSEI